MFAVTCKWIFSSSSLGVKDEVAMVMSSMHEWGKDMFDLVFPVKVCYVCYVSAVLMHIYYY